MRLIDIVILVDRDAGSDIVCVIALSPEWFSLSVPPEWFHVQCRCHWNVLKMKVSVPVNGHSFVSVSAYFNQSQSVHTINNGFFF